MMKQLLNYKYILLITCLFVLAAGCDGVTDITDTTESDQPAAELQAGDVIEGSYIIVMNVDADQVRAKGVSYVMEIREDVIQTSSIGRDVVKHTYDKALQGFSAELDESQLNMLRSDSRIAYIEKDKVVTLAPPCGTPRGGPCDDDPDDGDPDDGDPDDGGGGDDGGTVDAIVPWGIDRVGGAVTYSGSATSWVIDTGIQVDHPDLNVDANRGFSAFDRGPDSGVDDKNGHGTHVAGTIGAFNGIVGVASGVSQVPVKVLDRRGSGTISGVIAGIDYVAANANAGDVANMSLGGGASQALDDAVIAAANNGILFSIAAGNSSTLAENSSPARVDHPNTWTIAATDINDNFASFSNYGPPTSFAAPGVSVESTWNDSGYRTISGTSMAAPHVAGILLVTGGTVNSDGQSSTAPDGVNYPIASHK